MGMWAKGDEIVAIRHPWAVHVKEMSTADARLGRDMVSNVEALGGDSKVMGT